MRPAYSVVIPAFDAAQTIAAAIQSVLAQTVPPEQILVVDDGSGDATGAIAAAASSLVRVLRQDNAGVGSATTAGLAAVATSLVATLDADDVWLAEKMATQLDLLAADPACDGVFAAMRALLPDGRAGSVYSGMLRSTMLMRTAAARRVGAMIDPPGGCGDLIDWLARAREIGLRLRMVDTVLALRRIRPGSLSFARDAQRDRDYAYVAWLALKRRREREG